MVDVQGDVGWKVEPVLDAGISQEDIGDSSGVLALDPEGKGKIVAEADFCDAGEKGVRWGAEGEVQFGRRQAPEGNLDLEVGKLRGEEKVGVFGFVGNGLADAEVLEGESDAVALGEGEGDVIEGDLDGNLSCWVSLEVDEAQSHENRLALGGKVIEGGADLSRGSSDLECAGEMGAAQKGPALAQRGALVTDA